MQTLVCQLASSFDRGFNFIKLQQASECQACCNLSFADLMQLVETTIVACMVVDNNLTSLTEQLAASLIQLDSTSCIKPAAELLRLGRF